MNEEEIERRLQYDRELDNFYDKKSFIVVVYFVLDILFI